MLQAPPRLKSNQDLLPGIVGNSIKCSTTKHCNTQNFSSVIKQQFTALPPPSPKKVSRQQYYMEAAKPKKSAAALIDCHPFSKNKTEQDLSSFDKQIPSFRSPRNHNKPLSISFLTPTQTSYSINRSTSLQSPANVDLLIEELRQEFMNDESTKQQVIKKLKEKIIKDEQNQRTLKQEKLQELEDLKTQYLKFCQSITNNNKTQIELQQENRCFLEKIQQLERNINEIKTKIRCSEDKITHLDSLCIPSESESKHLKEMKKLFAELDDAVDDFCFRYEEENPYEDAHEILGFF